MSGSPLIRTKLSNEKLQSILLISITIYLLPCFIYEPFYILKYLLVILFSLIIDALLNFLRFKRIMCGVSASITAAVIFALYPDTVTYILFLISLISLILGKHIWGGTGENIFNPSVLGLAILYFLAPSLLKSQYRYQLLPLTLFLIPFIKVRPFASIGFLAGGLFSLYIKKDLSLTGLKESGLFFYIFIVISDPVTIRQGALSALMAGFSSLVYIFTNNFLVSVLIMNLYSYIVDKILYRDCLIKFKPLVLPKIISLNRSPRVIKSSSKNVMLTRREILERVKSSSIKGFGGGGFDFYTKLKSLLDSNSERSYLIINAVECDPGLLHDSWIVTNYLKEIEIAVKALIRVHQFEDIILATKDSIPNSSDILNIQKVHNHYPIGAEKILINKLFNIKLDSREIPSEEGFLVINVQTAFTLYRLLVEKEIDLKYITLGNLNSREGDIITVKNGERVGDILDREGIVSNRVYIGGGIMSGIPATRDDIITERVNSIYWGDIDRFKESMQCSHCNLCMTHCPSNINVRSVFKRVNKGLEVEELNRCLECHSCSYICLAGRDLCRTINRSRV